MGVWRGGRGSRGEVEGDEGMGGGIAPWDRHCGNLNGWVGEAPPLRGGALVGGGLLALYGRLVAQEWAVKAAQMSETMRFADDTELVPVSIILIACVLVDGDSHAVSSA